MKRALVFVAFAGAIAGACAQSPETGVMLVVSATDVYTPDDYDELQIRAGDKVESKKGKDIVFPTSIGIQRAPRGPLKIEVRALKDGIVRFASAVLTTAPADRVAVAKVTLSAACKDRCVQVGPDEPLTEFCEPKTRACVPEAALRATVASLPTFEEGTDPTKGAPALTPCNAGLPTGEQACSGSEVGELGCAHFRGEGSTGELTCLACRSVDAKSCSNGDGFEKGAEWPLVGRSGTHSARTERAGPRVAPSALKPINESINSVLLAPVIDSKGTVWYTASNQRRDNETPVFNLAARVVTVTNDSEVHVFQPDPISDCGIDISVQGSEGCRWTPPILTEDGEMWAMTNTGEGYIFDSPDFSKRPRPGISILSGLGFSCANQPVCNVTLVGPMLRNVDGERRAFIPSGGGMYIMRQDNTLKWVVQNVNAQCVTWGKMPAIARDGTMYVSMEFAFPNNPNEARGLCAMDKKGVTKWRSAPTRGLTTVPVIGPDDTIYFGSNDSLLYALDPANPKAFKWTFPTGGATTSPAIGVDGTLYFGSRDQNLYALDPADRSLKWTLRVKGEIVAQPIVDGTGVIYFGTTRGVFYAVGPNGAPIFETNVGSAIVEPAAIGQNGTLHFGSADGFIFLLTKQ